MYLFKKIIHRTRAKLLAQLAVSMALLIIINACASVGGSGSSLYAGDKWVILAMTNKSTDSSAAAISQSMVEANLRARNVNVIHTMTRTSLSNANNAELEAQMARAANAGARYGVTGSVSQWGREQLNGRDARVDIALSVYDLTTGEILWTGDAENAARFSSNTAKVANSTIMDLVNSMDLVAGVHPDTLSSKKSTALQTTAQALRSDASNSPVASSVGFRKVKLDDTGLNETVQQDVIGKSIAIFYGAKPPVSELAQFDRLVLEPDNITGQELSALKSQGASAYAYLSVGEVGPTRSYSSSIRPEWVLGKNDVWNSTVLDMTNPAWTQFLMQRISDLVNAGYTGLFLDTMDSYQLYASTPEQRAAQEAALGSFIQRVTQQFQGIKLISNRGFEVLDRTGPYLEAIAAESLFASWDNTAQRYVDVPENDRNWLLGKLNTAKSQFNLDVIAIEYMPPERRDEARQVATSVARLGFIPWVSTPALDYIGVGSMEVMPRKVMLLFDSQLNGKQYQAEVHELVAPILEYYGYVPHYIDIATQALPDGELVGQYAGMVTWSSSKTKVAGFAPWFKRQLESKLPVAMFGTPMLALDNAVSDALGISANGAIDADSLRQEYGSDWIGYEKSLPVRIENVGLNVQSRGSQNDVHLSVKDKRGVEADLVVTGDWGGFAAHPAAANIDLDDTYYWVTNPFAFLEKSLKLRMLPMPDVTTENGKRLWAAHIDGDALPSWAELPGRKLGAEYIVDKLIVPYNLPHSISIVEGEMVGVSDYADRRDRMFSVARNIFALPNVEIATHTYSHPYKWDLVSQHPTSGKYNLDVGNYQYSPEREIAGSAQFINEQLAPANKKTELMLWSGNAIPDESALAASYNAGLVNLNGGFTTINKAAPSISRISPMSRVVGPYVQAYAPIMNENVYTNDWLGPFDGFRRVIETFDMTDKPRRFKPISVYYHFYAGTKLASLRSLKEIYDWSVEQDILPVYASTYAKKVPHFRNAGVARYIDGSWKVSSLGTINSIRVLDRERWPELGGSRGLVGSRQLHDGMYIHTDGSQQVIFKTSDRKSQQVHLVSANGHVENWQVTGRGIELRVAGQVPVQIELSKAASACQIVSNGSVIRAKRTAQNTALFTFTNRDTGNVTLNCQA